MKVLVGLIIVVIVSLYSVWPMVLNPAQVPDYGHDGTLLVWLFNQPKLFDGNIYYPHPHTLAYSDRFLLSNLTARLPVAIANNPGVAFGWVMIVGQVLTLVVTYIWWTKLSGGVWGAVIATAALGLSVVRMEYQVHLQMWSMHYWLLGVYLLWLYFQTKKPWTVYVGALLVGLQFWESPLPVYFSAGVIMLIALMAKARLDKHLIVAATLAGLMAFPMATKYLAVSREFGYHRDIRDAAHTAISVNDLWQRFADPTLFALLAVAVIKVRKGHKWLWLVLALGIVMALGPVLKWQGHTTKILGMPIPLPYVASYYLVPGFDGLRTPSRWLWLSTWAGSGLIAVGLSKIKLKHLLLGLTVVIVGGSRVTTVVAFPKQANYPLVYTWLKNQPGRTVLQLPVYLWHDSNGREEMRMYYGLYHGKLLVNGYSGFTPPDYIELYKHQAQSTSWPQVDYVVIDKDEMDLDKTAGLSKMYEDEENIVYSGSR